MTDSAATRLAAWAHRHATPFYWREAALCAPAIPALFALGVVFNQPVYGAVAAGAAFTVGFGAARDLRGQRWAAMSAAVVGVTIATFVGCVSGEWRPALAGVAAVAAAVCAALALLEEDLWWVSLQVVIALLIASYYPSAPGAALARAVAVFIGGATQMLLVMVLARLFPAAAARLPPGPPKPPPTRALLFGHMARAAVCVAAGLVAAQKLGLSNSYWAPMTAMLVLKPGLSETQSRGLARLVGTLLGCAVASLFVMAAGDLPWAMLAGITACATCAYALQKAHYAMLSGAITATVVLLLTLGRGGVIQNAEHRLAATILGGVIALVVARIAPHRPLTSLAAEDRVGAA